MSQFKTIPPCPITTHPRKQLFSLLFICSLQVLEGHNRVFPEPSLLQAKQVPSTFPHGRGALALYHLSGPLLYKFVVVFFFCFCLLVLF